MAELEQAIQAVWKTEGGKPQDVHQRRRKNGGAILTWGGSLWRGRVYISPAAETFVARLTVELLAAGKWSPRSAITGVYDPEADSWTWTGPDTE